MTATFEGAKSQKKIKFESFSEVDFYPVVRKRVEEHFHANNIPFQGSNSLYIKGFALTFAYICLYAAIMSNSFGLLGLSLLYGLLGITKGLIGFNVIHDALHGAFSSNRKLNRILGYWFDLNGTSSYIWKISHNLHHHVYTNIPGYDNDIDKAIVLRLNPTDKVYWFHKYQQWYAPILYGLIAFNWVFYADYKWFYDQSKKRKIPSKELTLFFALKAVNLFLFLILPLLILSVPWWYVVIAYSSMLFCGGLTIATIFQLAHIVDNVEYFEPDESGQVHNKWAEHELMTTSNFATDNNALTSIIGGLNFQIEHHLFPHISHVHYPKVQAIVKATAKEFRLPYYEQPTFFEAIKSHFRTLKRLGTETTTVNPPQS